MFCFGGDESGLYRRSRCMYLGDSVCGWYSGTSGFLGSNDAEGLGCVVEVLRSLTCTWEDGVVSVSD